MCLPYRGPSPFQAPSQYGRANKGSEQRKKRSNFQNSARAAKKQANAENGWLFTVFLDPFSPPSCIWSLEQAIENRAKSLKNGVDQVIHGQEIR